MTSHNIFFIDSRITDYQTLIGDLLADAEWSLINADEDGVKQMQSYLADKTGYDSLQIISHGSAGSIYLGSTILSSININDYAAVLANIGQSLTETGDILLYGCNVAQGIAGQAFISSLANATEANVAASNNLTGKGGDWVLEYSSGAVESSLITAPAYQGVLLTDILASTLTTSVLTIDGVASSSTIDTFGDNDWWKVSLTAGTVYKFAQNETIWTGLDPYLELFDSRGILLETMDITEYVGSIITFTPITTGIYYLSAGGFNTSTGDYTISARPNNLPLTISMITPANGATGAYTSGNIVVTFTEAIQMGTGSIELRKGSATGDVVETFDATTNRRLSISGFTLSIDPAWSLSPNTTYYVTFDSGSIQDLSSNNYAGLTTYGFTTGAAYGPPGNGLVTTNFGGGFYDCVGMALQSNNKIILAGTIRVNGTNDFALVRYNSDGSLDTSFGGNGLVTTDFIGKDNNASSVMVQNDGKILLAGDSTVNGTQDFALVRYNSDGSLDSSFGSNGLVTTDFNGKSADYASDLVLQTDGKILVAGTAGELNYYLGMTYVVNNFAVVRYNNDGSLDSSFGAGGIVTLDSSGDDHFRSVTLQTDGKILVAGRSDYDPILARLNNDGSLDSSFGSGGAVITHFEKTIGGLDVIVYIYSVALQADGKILVGGLSLEGANGYNFPDSADFTLLRYNVDGSLDTTFSGDGKVVTDFKGRDDYCFFVEVQANGKILLSGDSHGNSALARYNSDGSLDTSFGGDGLVVGGSGRITSTAN